MTGETCNRTLGLILIKYDSGQKGREAELRDFILSLLEKKGVALQDVACQNCFQINNGDKCCDDLDFISIATLVGFFDFAIIVKAIDIETVEKFIINCLRNGDKRDLISETQTICGIVLKG